MNKKIIVFCSIVISLIALWILLSFIGSYQRFHASKPVQISGITSVQVTPDGFSEPVDVSGHPHFSIDANPETTLVIRITRLDGTMDEKVDRGPGTYTDLGGGVKTLRFKSKILTMVYVTLK